MKKIIGVLTLIVLLVLIAPKIVGNQAHQAFQQTIEKQMLAQSSLVIQKNSYEQSWFASDSELQLHLAVGDEDLDAITWHVHAHIQHGPLMWTDAGLQWGMAYIDYTLNVTDLPDDLQQFVDEKLGRDAITATTFIDFQQVLHDTLSLKPFDIEADKMTAHIGGIQLSSTDTVDLSSMQGQAKILASNLSGDELHLTMNDALVNYDYSLWQDDMMLGTSLFTLPQFKATTKQGNFVFNDITISSKQQANPQGKLEISESIEVKAIEAPLPVTALNYDIAIHQMDPQVLSQLDAVQQSMQQGAAATSPLQNEALRKFLTTLFQDDLSLNQKLVVAALGGTLNIQADARYVALPDGKQLVDVLGTETALQAADIHIVADVDKSVVEQLPFGGMVGVLVKQGVVSINGDRITTDVKLAKGALTVNAKAIPVNLLYPWLGITANDEAVLDN